MNKEKLRELMIKAMPDFVSENVKQDIANIMMKVLEAVDGESTTCTVIALDILKDFHQDLVERKMQVKVGSDSKSYKESLINSGTVH